MKFSIVVLSLILGCWRVVSAENVKVLTDNPDAVPKIHASLDYFTLDWNPGIGIGFGGSALVGVMPRVWTEASFKIPYLAIDRGKGLAADAGGSFDLFSYKTSKPLSLITGGGENIDWTNGERTSYISLIKVPGTEKRSVGIRGGFMLDSPKLDTNGDAITNAGFYAGGQFTRQFMLLADVDGAQLASAGFIRLAGDFMVLTPSAGETVTGWRVIYSSWNMAPPGYYGNPIRNIVARMHASAELGMRSDNGFYTALTVGAQFLNLKGW